MTGAIHHPCRPPWITNPRGRSPQVAASSIRCPALIRRRGAEQSPGRTESRQGTALDRARWGKDGPCHEREVYRDHPWRHWQQRRPSRVVLGLLHLGNRRSGCETCQFLAEEDEVNRCRYDDGSDGAPTKIRDHERDVPPPRARHHQHRRCRELRQRPTNRTTLTNNTPSVAYFSRVEGCRSKNCRASSSAQIVIAAGSVMNEPSTGPIVRPPPTTRQVSRHQQPPHAAGLTPRTR